MSGLLGRVLGIPKAPTIAGFKVQTSAYGQPIPIVYGMTRVAGNLMHMPKQPVQVGSNHSKLAGSKGANAGQMYEAPMAIGLCEGPILNIGYVWRDKDGKLTFTGNYDVDGWGFKFGVLNPNVWTYLTSNYPAQAAAYQFTAYVNNSLVPLPNNVMSQYSWEVLGFLPFDGSNDPFSGGVKDASPAAIVPDFLQSTQYGVSIPSSRFAATTAFADYCASAGLFASVSIDTQKPAADWVNDLLEVANTALVWSDGLIKFIPYGDTALSGNGHTYTPNTTPLYDLTDADFLPRSGDYDPILVTRTDPATAYNQVTVEYLDRSLDYNVSTYTAQDQIAVETYGTIALPTLTLHMITSVQVAQQVAQMRLQREQNVRNTYSFRLGWRYSLLEPMDLVTLTDAGLGLNKTPVRIVSIAEGTDEQGFDVVAEEWPFGTASATLYGVPNPFGMLPNVNVDPGNTVTPVIFEGPVSLQSAPLEIYVGASGGQYWGGCDVWISVDNVNFSKIGRVVGKATYGVTTASLATAAAYPTVDTTNTLAVDLSASGGTLVAQSNLQFTNLVPLAYLGGAEWVAFRDVLLTSANHYNLTHLYRGLFGSTIPSSHSSGVPFVFIDDTIIRIPWPTGYTGQTLYFKFPAFNIYGAALQDVATVTAISHVVGQDPVINGSGSTNNASGQGTITIDATGHWGFVCDGPGNAQSFQWQASSSAFPTDVAVVAGPSASSSGSRTFSGDESFGYPFSSNLTVGQTVYITIVPWTGATVGTGTQMPSVHLKGTYGNSAIAQGTVDIDSNGSWSFTIDGPVGTQSWRYATSTSGFPSDATVAAASPTGSGPVLTVTAGGTLAFGQTVYVSAIPYSGTGGTGIAGQSIHIRGAYLTYTATRTSNYAASQFAPSYSSVNPYQLYQSDGSLRLTSTLPNATLADFSLFPIVPDGATITSVAFTTFWSSGIPEGGMGVSFSRINSSSITSLGTASATNVGWQTLTISLSENTTNNSYEAHAQFSGRATVTELGQAGVAITYTKPDPKANV